LAGKEKYKSSGKKQAVKAISLWWLGSLQGAGFAFLTPVILVR
jgi:hypothetical protein